MNMGFRLHRLLTAMYTTYLIGMVVGQSDTGIDLGDLSDILDQLDLGDIDFLGTEEPNQPDVTVEQDIDQTRLICYECGEVSKLGKTDQARSCAKPSRTTLNGTVCSAPRSGHTNQCGWMEVTVTTPTAREEMSELYWIFRGCVPVPDSSDIGDNCFTNANLVATLDYLGMPLTEIVGASSNSNITGKGCFCNKDYCNGASSLGLLTLRPLLAVTAFALAILN